MPGLTTESIAMTVTPTSLTRAAGAAAVAAGGEAFIGVQIGHPHLDITSIHDDRRCRSRGP